MSESMRTAVNLREALRGELAAISEYDRFAVEAETAQMRELFEHIASDERHHVAEEYRALVELDPEQGRAFKEVFRLRQAGDAPAQRTFTRQELARFTGQGGRPAYVAVENVVYDVTNVPAWRMGTHGPHTAGQDLTIFFRSQHDLSILQRLPKVGVLNPQA